MPASLIFFIIFFQDIPVINPKILVWLGCVTPQIENRWESLLNSTFAAIWANKKCLNDLSHQSYVIFTKFDGFLVDMLSSQISLDGLFFLLDCLHFYVLHIGHVLSQECILFLSEIMHLVNDAC